MWKKLDKKQAVLKIKIILHNFYVAVCVCTHACACMRAVQKIFYRKDAAFLEMYIYLYN